MACLQNSTINDYRIQSDKEKKLPSDTHSVDLLKEESNLIDLVDIYKPKLFP